jgi:hypothetical protein
MPPKILLLTLASSLLPLASILLLPTQANAAPYPPSPVITNITFDTATFRSLAPGSDNWPLTWGANNHQYTSWGDGGGFGGTNTNGRVSLGFARIEGTATNFSTYNIYGGVNAQCSASISGKSYGIVDIDGILYAWISPGSNTQNYSEARLYRSTNLGCTWSSTSVVFTQSQNLILPSILQFGPGYTNTLDDYVYMYATRLKTSSSLTIQAPGEVDLLRVPKNNITNLSSYQFYAGLSNNQPVWTSTIGNRQPVFRVTEGVGWAPPGVTYNPGINRYLLTVDDGTLGVNSVSGRGMGIYDAPNPWGPWTTVTHIESFNYEPTFFYHFSPKWIYDSGRTMWLVFSGTGTYDAFLLIKTTLTTGTTSPSPTPSRTPTPSTASPTPSRTPTPASSPTPSRTPTPGPSPTPQSGGSISNLVKYDGYDWQLMSNLQVGNAQYTDRSFTFSSLPSFLLGTQWISTANSSRSFTGEVQATFTLTQSATVYVAHNDAIFTRPSWLSSTNGWTQTQSSLTNSEPRTFTLFSRSFPQGSTVSLGPNNDTGASMYSIFVIPSTPNYSLDNDTDIDIYDILILISRFTQNLLGDFNQNGRIDIFDYNTLFKNRL